MLPPLLVEISTDLEISVPVAGTTGYRDLRGLGSLLAYGRATVRLLWTPPGDPCGAAGPGGCGAGVGVCAQHRSVPSSQGADRPGGRDASADVGGGAVRCHFPRAAGAGGQRHSGRGRADHGSQRSGGRGAGGLAGMAVHLRDFRPVAGSGFRCQPALVSQGTTDERVRRLSFFSRYGSLLSLGYFRAAVAVGLSQRIAYWTIVSYYAAYLIKTYGLNVGFAALPLWIVAVAQVIRELCRGIRGGEGVTAPRSWAPHQPPGVSAPSCASALISNCGCPSRWQRRGLAC